MEHPHSHSSSSPSSLPPPSQPIEIRRQSASSTSSSRKISEDPPAAPSTFLGAGARPPMKKRTSRDKRLAAVDRDQKHALQSIRNFLRVRTAYDVMPLSFRLIVLDTTLLVKSSLAVMTQMGIVSAPLWDSKSSNFAGLITTTDFLNVVQYVSEYPEARSNIDKIQLLNLRDLEKAIKAPPIETISINPLRPLYDACRMMLKARARRIPVVDEDVDTGRSACISVITQYRILKFIAVNNIESTRLLRKPIKELGLGTYGDLATAYNSTSVIDVIHMLVSQNISSVPILDEATGVVINVFEAYDVIQLLKDDQYEMLEMTVGEAVMRRPAEFGNIFACSIDDRLDTLFDMLRKARVHRFIVTDDETGHLVGMLTLSDILEYILLDGESGDKKAKPR